MSVGNYVIFLDIKTVGLCEDLGLIKTKEYLSERLEVNQDNRITFWL